MPASQSYLQGQEIGRLGEKRVSAVVVWLLLLVISLSAEAQQLLPPITCPDFSQRGGSAASQVSVSMAEALHPSGLVCVHIKNGEKRAIQISQEGLRLERRGRRGNKQQFQDYETVWQEQLKLSGGETSGIEREGAFAVGQGAVIAPQGTLAVVLPSDALPVRPGMYRVCLRYIPPGGKTPVRLCSAVAPVSSSLSSCPPLPVQPSTGKVSLHVAKAVDMPGVVCMRVINGLATEVTYGQGAFWLQKWERGRWEKSQLSSLSTLKLPSGETVPVAKLPLAFGLSEGMSEDRYLPRFGTPASPGKYRACFTFWQPQKDKQMICSSAFLLP